MIAIIDSGIGNIRSVANALEHIGASYIITTNENEITKADKIVFPGVGAFCDGMEAIKKTGLIEVIKKQVFTKKKLYLGICLGMQLLAETGKEDGNYKGLGWIKGEVSKIRTHDRSIKLPHIGWNNILIKNENPLFNNLPQNPTFYFVHSYVIDPQEKSLIAATCNYGEEFVASIHKDNIFGVQFHPEKSQKNGLQLLNNFASIKS